MCRADSVTTPTTCAAQRNCMNRFRRTILTTIRRPRYSSLPGPNQRRGSRRAHFGRPPSAKHRLRSGISTVIPNCCRMATPEARLPLSSRATARASKSGTTTRQRNIGFLMLTLRTPAPFLPKTTQTIRRFTTITIDEYLSALRTKLELLWGWAWADPLSAKSGRQVCARSGSVGGFSGRHTARLQRLFGEFAPALLWPAPFDVRRNLYLTRNGVGQPGGQLSNSTRTGAFRAKF